MYFRLFFLLCILHVSSLFSQNSGTYQITGKDSFGAYKGVGQIIGSTSNATIIRQIEYLTYSFQGKKVHQVWKGLLQNNQMSFQVQNSQFIFANNKEYKSFQAIGNVSGANTLSIQFGSQITEKWIFTSSNQTPLWQNERHERVVTSDSLENLDGLLNTLSSSFSKQSILDKYRDKPEFKNEQPITTIDLTDFQFLRKNRNSIRVIQSLINQDSLLEAYSRNLAYSYNLQEKEAIFYQQMLDRYINNKGFFSYKTTDGKYLPDGDSAAWTGIWTFVLVSKYLKSHDELTAYHIQNTISSFINALNIVTEGNSFARYLDEYQEGHGLVQSKNFPDLSYIPGGNNDMLKGYLTGLYWGTIGLKAQGLLETYAWHILNALTTLQQKSDVAKDGLNNLLINIVKYEVEPSNEHKRAVLSELGLKNLVYIRQAGFPMNFKGISDWSGNHLNTMSFMLLRDFFSKNTSVFKTIEKVNGGLARLSGSLKGHRLGLLDLVSGQWRSDIDLDQVNDGIIRLLEVPIERGLFKAEHVQHPNYVMSPYPNLPWKKDWQETNRLQSIKNYPLFELGWDSYYWKSNFYDSALKSGQNYDHRDVGLDFLVAYWFAQYANISLLNY